MPRLMSFAKTVEQIEAGSKTVTRRDGWAVLKPGDVIECVDRSPRMGKGFRRLGLRRVVSIRFERLGDITPEDVTREGFPGKTTEWFVQMYCAPKAPDPDRVVRRIELEESEPKCPECGKPALRHIAPPVSMGGEWRDPFWACINHPAIDTAPPCWPFVGREVTEEELVAAGWKILPF